MFTFPTRSKSSFYHNEMPDVDENKDRVIRRPPGEGASRKLEPFSPLLTKELVKNSSLSLNISSTGTVMEDLVHLFKGLAVRLGDTEVGPHKRQQAKDCEKDVSPEASLLDKGWGDEADNEIP
jgi:hypothetical protein